MRSRTTGTRVAGLQEQEEQDYRNKRSRTKGTRREGLQEQEEQDYRNKRSRTTVQ